MRNVLNTSGRWVTAGWLLPLVLLALPNCTLNSGPYDPPPLEFQTGESPTDAIMCEIPMPRNEGDENCATDEELAEGGFFSMSEAATLLASGQDDPIVLDWSDDAKSACDGGPRKVEFYGTYPDGLRVCINCTEKIPSVYATEAKACIAKCKDLLTFDAEIVPAEGVSEYCLANAKVAINVNPQDICYEGACTAGGNPNNSFVDPRRDPEPVVWVDHIGTDDDGGTNTLHRSAMTTGGTTADFNAGAVSAQIIKGGDAWVEFAAGDSTTTVHVLALRESLDSAGQKCFEAIDCPDTDPHIEFVGFAIDLNSDGMVYVLTPGATPGTFDVSESKGPYFVGERYRVKVKDLHNGKTDVSYVRIVGDCPSGTQCEEDLLATTVTANSKYPLRVDTTFREEGASLENVTIMRIKQ